MYFMYRFRNCSLEKCGQFIKTDGRFKNTVWSKSKDLNQTTKIWQEPMDKFKEVLSKAANKIVLTKSNGNMPLERPEGRPENNTKMDVKETLCIKISAAAN